MCAEFFATEKNAERAGRSMTGARQMGRRARSHKILFVGRVMATLRRGWLVSCILH